MPIEETDRVTIFQADDAGPQREHTPVDKLLPPGRGATRSLADLRAALGIPAIPNNVFTSGTYTPVSTIVTNLDSTTPQVSIFQRTGDVVQVWVPIDVDATVSGGTASNLRLSLPIAQVLAAVTDLSGLCNSLNTVAVGNVQGNVANDEADVLFAAGGTNSTRMIVHFMYRII